MVFGSLGSSANQVLIKIKGDDKDFQNALKKSDSSMSGFASKMKTYGPMIGAAFGAAAIGFVAMSVKMAAAEEAVSRQTEALLKSQGVMWSAVGGELDAYMKQLEELTAYNDTDLQVAFNSMIAAGMNYTDAMESMNTVTSMAFSLNRDLGSMALLVGKAYNGQTGELSRYGIVLDEGLDKTEKFAALQEHVADNFANAEERVDSYEGQMESLKNQMSNFAEATGKEVLPALTEVLDKMSDVSAGASEWGTVLGRLIAMPVALPLQLIEHREIQKEVNALIKDGTDTEQEFVELLGLHSSKLTEISDIEFERATAMLTMAGYYEKSNMLQNARDYGLKQEIISLEQINALEKERTTEIEKQLTLEQMAAQINLGIQARGGFGGAKMSAATAKDLSVSDANINPNITSSVRSGV